MKWLRNRTLIFFAADEGGGAGAGASAADPNTTPEGGNNSNNEAVSSAADPGKTFTQAELDKIISDRLKREQKAWETKIEDEKRKAAMTEAEKLKAEKEEAENKSKATSEAANKRIITAEAKLALSAAGVRPERITAALKLADLSGVTVGEDGEPDAQAVKAAVEAVAKSYPEFKAANSTAGGSNYETPNAQKKLDVANMSQKDFAELQRKVMRGEKINL